MNNNEYRPAKKRFVSGKAFLVAATAMISPAAMFAGQMDVTIGTQVYRDLAENRGVYQAGNTVTIYDLNGVVQGTIANIPNFDNSVDIGQAALVGSSQFTVSVAHDNNTGDVTFTQRFGATSGTPFYDVYHDIGHAKGYTDGTWNYKYDTQVIRLDKVVTEAAAAPYLTDTTVAANLKNYQVIRIGGGTNFLRDYAANSTVTIGGAYDYLTAGSVGLSTVEVIAPTSSANQPASYTTGYAYTQNATSDTTALPLPIYLGDSGSPIYVYNTNTNRWEFAGAASWVSYGTGANGEPITGGSRWTINPAFLTNTFNSYVSPTITTSGASNITWNTPNASGAGTITQGASTWNYVGLASTVHGATSTTSASGASTLASDAQLDAARDLVFAGTGGTIVLGGSIDMGAGSLTFNSNYTLTDGGVTTRRLNTAGFIVNAGVTLTSQLTGASGDEWRKIGDGKLVISGSGANLADLNVGGGGITELNRSGGAAAHDVIINGGGATVRLIGANQISGDVVFGHRGGVLDLYGNSMSDAAITHLDYGATIANLKANATSTFTFTGSGTQAFLGSFTDGGALANGILNVVYAPTTASGAVWTLNGINGNAGTWAINGGEAKVQGTPTLHADNYVDPNDWQTALFDTGLVSVASGATFTAADHAIVVSNVSVAAGGTFKLADGAIHTGNVALVGATSKLAADVAVGHTVSEAGAITGLGGLTKTGSGTLSLSNTGNTFSGANTISGGTVLGTSLAALGGGSANWTVNQAGVIAATGSTAASVKAKLVSSSTGTLALSGTTPDANPDLTGYASLSLGAIGNVTVGTAGTSSLLTKWTASNTGWNLGGGGGTLTMNLKLSGTGTLTVGNGQNLGTVVLTNANNNNTTGGAAFTGSIVVNPGVSLQYTDINALGTLSGADRIAVGYGSQLGLGTGANAVTVFNAVTTASSGILAISGTDTNAYSFSGQGLNSAALGAAGTATYSGTLTAGTGGYKFGGNGALTVSSVLAGTAALSADGQSTVGGVTTLSGANTFTGAVTVQGGVLNGVTGSHTLKLGSNSALGANTNTLTVNDGGIVDVNGKTETIGGLTGTAASSILNSSATASTLTVNLSSDSTFAGTLAAGTGAFNLVKSGTGVLTLSGANAQSGSISVTAGGLKLGSATALGAATNTVAIASGGSLDLNGMTVVDNVAVSLAGTGGTAGTALANSSTTAKAYIKNVSLTANTTISNTSAQKAIVIGSTSSQDGTLTLAGYTLTKEGTGTLILNGVNMTGAGNIVVNAGKLQIIDDYTGGYQKDTTLAGTGTLTINSGASVITPKWGVTLAMSMPIVLNGGTLGSVYPGSNGATIASNISVTANSTLNFNGGGYGNVTFSGVISGSSGLTVGGDGATRTFTGVNTYTGAITLSAGTLKIDGAGSLGSGSYGGALALASGTTFNYHSTANQTLSGVVSGAGAVVKDDIATLTYTGANTYTGATTVAAGTLQVGAGGTAGTLGTGAVSVATGATLAFNRSDSLVVANAISGAGTLVKNGAGTVVLTGTNSITGYTISAGTLQVGNAGMAGTLGASTAVTNNAALAFSRTDNGVDLAGAISGTGAVTYQGTGTSNQSSYTVNDASTYSGGTTSNLSRINLSNASGLGTGTVTVNSGGQVFVSAALTLANNFILSGNGWTESAGQIGALRIGTTSTLTGNISLAGNTRIGTGASNTGTLSGVISGTANLEIGGNSNITGVTVLSGANTFSGTTTVTGGTLRLANTNALQNSTLTTAGIEFDSSVASHAFTLGGLSGSSNLALQDNAGAPAAVALSVGGNNGSTTYSGVLSGAGSLTKAGTGTLILTGAQTYTGTTSVSGGTLQLGSGGTTGAIGAGAVTLSGGTLAFNRSDDISWSNTLSGTGSLVKSGTGALTLAGTNTLTGALTVNAGILRLGSATALGAATNTVNIASGGSLDLNGFIVTDNVAVSLAGTGGAAGTALANSSTTAKAYIKNVSLTANTTIANTSAQKAIVIGSTTAQDATLNLAGYTLTKDGTGTLILNGVNMSGAGNITVNAGTLQILDDYTGGYAKNTTLAGTGSLTINSGGTVSIPRWGSTLALSMPVVLNGGTLGSVWPGPNGATIASNISVTANSTLNFGGGYGNVTFSGVISGTAGLTVSGDSATRTFSGSNTYSGGTTVTAGTLLAGSNTAFGTGSVSVNSGATLNTGASGSGRTLANAIAINSGGTLKGFGTLNGAVTVASGGILSPGSSPGTLTFGGGVTLASGATYLWEITGAAPSVAGTDFDRIVITAGTLSINSGSIFKIAASGIDYTTAFWDSTRTFTVASKSGTGTISGLFGTVDTSAAGTFDADGSWLIQSSGGELQAVWNPSLAPVPEPSTYGLLGAGALAAAALVRRRKRVAVA